MFIRKNIWTIFYILLFLGGIYLVTSILSAWQDIKNDTRAELSYLNRIFSSSVSSNFDQQEIMLDLLGHQLLNNDFYKEQAQAELILDRILQQNHSLLALALSNIDGQLIVTSSNLDIKKVANLRTSKESSETFLHALKRSEMVLGKTYYFDPARSLVIPMRKSIRNSDNKVTGVMIAGTKPGNLLPMLNSYKNPYHQINYQAMLLQDKTFNYTYLNNMNENMSLKNMISEAVPAAIIQQHDLAIQQQLGSSISSLMEHNYSAEYFAPSVDGTIKLFSLLYIPKYQLWAVIAIPRFDLIKQLINASEPYVISSIAIMFLLFFLFNAIDKSEKKKRNELIEQANHDFLTGLYNRQYLTRAESSWINAAAPPFGVYFIDLDNFKNINDSYGHSYGDIILKEVAQRLRGFFSSDQVICRQGGDEFIILSREINISNQEDVAKDLLQELSRPYRINLFHFVIGASIGICRYPEDGDNFDTLFSAADTAMYRAKQRRNNYFVFSEDLHQQTLLNSRIEQALHNALKNNEFTLVYQPQINNDGSIFGMEALLRWHNHELGQVAPDQFIHIAEDSGFIIPLGHFILERAISDLTRLEIGPELIDMNLSINVSVRQLQEEDFAAKIASYLHRYHCPAHRVTLEITESIFIDDYDYLMPVLQDIRDMGCKLSLDDFGTGYSSLSMLRNLPIDELKIDKSFIDQMFNSSPNKAMVLNIINIAKNLGLNVVAEGIETQPQSDLLLEFGCDIQQGYLFAKPMPYDQIQDFIARPGQEGLNDSLTPC